MKKGVLSAFIILMLVVGFGCGNDDNGANPKPSKIVVTLQPEALTQGVGLVDSFTATVTGGTNHALSWSVNDVPGGDSATVGSISTETGQACRPTIQPGLNSWRGRSSMGIGRVAPAPIIIGIKASVPQSRRARSIGHGDWAGLFHGPGSCLSRSREITASPRSTGSTALSILK
jgi:hypothetical protein